MSKINKEIIGLIKGRHELPTNEYIFEKIEDVKDISSMKEVVAKKLKYCNELELYVTGLTVALVEVINFCIYNNIKLSLWHYDISNGSYFMQKTATDIHTEYLEEGGYL